MYDKSVALELPRNVSSTRGNKYKLQNHSFHYNFRKFSFAARIVNVWNSLPDHVVDVNSLKGVLQRTFFISTNERLM